MIKKALGLAALSLATIASSGCHKGSSPTGPDDNMVFNVGDNNYSAPEYNAAVPCSSANPNDNIPDDDALNTCLRQGGEIILQPGEPGYLIEKGLYVQGGIPFTTLKGASFGQKPKLVAHPNLPRTLFFGDGVHGLTLENLFVDGNKYQRTYNKCYGFPRAANILIRGGSFRVINVESVRTVCGSGLDVAGENFVIANNHIEDSGYDRVGSIGPNPWADGITLGECNNGQVYNNTVIDSTDLGIVAGDGPCVIENNKVYQYTQKAFGGIALHNFTPGGHHEGTIIQNNVIESSPNMLDTGLNIGIHYWFPRDDTFGGRVVNNRVSGAIYNMSIEGALNTYIQGNTLENPSPGNIAVVPCDNKIYTNLAVGHLEQVCMQYEQDFKGVIFDNGNGKCSYNSDACLVANQMPSDCPSKAEWQARCATKR